MESIVDLLEEKNYFLKKFYDLNEREIIGFSEGNFDHLDEFYNTREKILGVLNRIDKLVEQHTSTDYNEAAWTSEQRKKMVQALDTKNELVTRILSQDLQILSFIEDAKSEIIKELTVLQTSKKALRSYKSGRDKRRVNEKV